ncbi:MBL fold metallo-hydrolase [Blastopirellula sp. J2-11]|uniref:MBL fold metallo-hydrolase n=1 Tax=Blastopirellula sp. J2-11 TaxID=2943192 RepID=UPI0021C7064F|nr:MBL fold metallo-hydrolase [Blastopirellula sp. J2-11]UUO07483.1 MBL fold metallo-hydrolase [Blastopirellula sp. J2-11]
MNSVVKPVKTRDIRGKLILLGTGTSVGVPAIGCGCPVCTSCDPHNKRMRCSVIWGLPEGNLLVDTPPDMRSQLLREDIGIVHAVAYTHQHADHLYGLDDLRVFQFYLGHGVPLFCEENVERQIRAAFSYAFSKQTPTHVGATPALEFQRIDLHPFAVLGAQVTPIRLKHGPRFEVLGFRIGNIAYCTDTNEIPEESLALLQGLDVLILDALRFDPHPTHFSLDEAVAMAEKIGAKQTYFTHVSCRMDHQETNAKLPAHMQLAYDRQEIPLS